MNAYSRFFRPLMPPAALQVINAAVNDFVDQCSTQITSKLTVHPSLAAAKATRVVTVGPSPNDSELLQPHGSAGTCVPVGREWGETGEQLVADLNRLMEAHGVDLAFQWTPDVEPTAHAMGHQPTIGLASCDQPPSEVVQSRKHEVPVQLFWKLSDTPVTEAAWSIQTGRNQTVEGSISDNALVVPPEHAAWRDALALEGGQTRLEVDLFNATMGTGQFIRAGEATLVVDAGSLAILDGAVMSAGSVPRSTGANGIGMVYLPPSPGDGAGQQLAGHVLVGLGVRKTPLVQSDVTGTLCESTGFDNGAPASGSVLPVNPITCAQMNYWPEASAAGPVLGPLDLGTLNSAYPVRNQSRLSGPAAEGFTLSEAQQAIQEMVATRCGAQMTGAFCAALASTVVHHLLTQGAVRLPGLAQVTLNTLVIPALRSIVYAVVAYHFTTGATTVFRVAAAGIPALVQGLSLVAPLPQFIQALATALSVSGIAVATIELMRGNVMPGMGLLAAVVGQQVAHLVMAAFDELLRHLAPLPGGQELHLEQNLYARPAHSALSELVDCAQERGAPAVPWPAAATAVGAVMKQVDHRLAQGIDGVVTLRPATDRLARLIRHCANDLDAVSSAESSSGEDEHPLRAGRAQVALQDEGSGDETDLSDDPELIEYLQTGGHLESPDRPGRAMGWAEGHDDASETDEVTAVQDLFADEGFDPHRSLDTPSPYSSSYSSSTQSSSSSDRD